MSIKNKDIINLIREKENRVDCENCKYCHIGAYHNGKWYCANPNVSIFDIDTPSEIEKCFVRKGKK